MIRAIRWVCFGAALAAAGFAAPAPAGGPVPAKDWHRTPSHDDPGAPGPGVRDDFDLSAWEARRFRGLSNWPPAETDLPVDAVHYDLDLAFDPAGGNLSGTATVTLVWGSEPGNILHLDLVGLTATAVRKPKGGHYGYVQDADGLDITLTPAPAPDDTVTVLVDYQGLPARGFYARPAASYTFTEPDDSRYWFPCRDVPWDKATVTLHGTVPSGKVLVGNGVLVSTSSAGGSVTYHWSETHPIAPYLVAAAISGYAYVEGSTAVTPLGWYVYPAHTAQAATAFQNLDAMMEFYDATLAPYPFDKYVMCEAPFGGGMEHQSATLIGEAIVTAGLGYEWITAHELAHQWFGDYVTMADWRHIWLNEGFATFYDAVWHEDFYGPASFDARMQTFENNVIWWQANRTDHPILDPPPDQLFSWIEYYKAGWVLRMLRDLVGRPAFDTAVANYLAAHAYGNAETDDFRAAVEAAHGEPLDWFFEQWIVSGTGRPQIAYVPVYTPAAGGWLAQIDIRQVQAAPTTYRFPLEIRISTAAGDTLVTGWIEEREQVLAFPLASEPFAVELDPANRILGEMVPGATTGIAGGEAAPLFRAGPNPFRESLRVEAAAGRPGAALEIFDVAGRRVRELELPPGGGATVWDGRDAGGSRLPSGAYFLRVRGTGEAIRVIRLGGR